MRRDKLLIFSRWCQVMFRFERAMYADPDRDLEALWWDLVEEYQGLRRPESRHAPDFASKIHVVGPLLLPQLHDGRTLRLPGPPHDRREGARRGRPGGGQLRGTEGGGPIHEGASLHPGRALSWDALTRHATGSNLNPEAFAEDFRGA
ncbi:MAG: hypothetical protein WKF75_15920 [Singulisphaera sp.]